MKTALEMMDPPAEEFEAGEKAALDLVAHMKRMGAAATQFEIRDSGTLWVVKIEAQTAGAVN